MHWAFHSSLTLQSANRSIWRGLGLDKCRVHHVQELERARTIFAARPPYRVPDTPYPPLYIAAHQSHTTTADGSVSSEFLRGGRSSTNCHGLPPGLLEAEKLFHMTNLEQNHTQTEAFGRPFRRRRENSSPDALEEREANLLRQDEKTVSGRVGPSSELLSLNTRIE